MSEEKGFTSTPFRAVDLQFLSKMVIFSLLGEKNIALDINTLDLKSYRTLLAFNLGQFCFLAKNHLLTTISLF